MREVRIHVPETDVDEISGLAFDSGVQSVSVHPEERRRAGGERQRTIALEAATSTPKARKFIAAVLRSPRYDPATYTINVKSPRAIISSETLKEITRPRLEPGTDLMEE